jgi:phosphotransferase system  glucose/maltose/N-acetylglucosamine-specific IIC component
MQNKYEHLCFIQTCIIAFFSYITSNKIISFIDSISNSSMNYTLMSYIVTIATFVIMFQLGTVIIKKFKINKNND